MQSAEGLDDQSRERGIVDIVGSADKLTGRGLADRLLQRLEQGSIGSGIAFSITGR